MTAHRNLPSFREFLAENDEDIVSGLRQLVTDIRSNWRTPYSSVRQEQKKYWSKLTPSQQENLKRIFNLIVVSRLNNIDMPIETDVFNPTTKAEASVIPLTFMALATGARTVAQGMLSDARISGIITNKEAAEFAEHFKTNGDQPMDPKLGPIVKDFVQKHRSQLSSLVAMQENDVFGFDVSRMQNAIATAIASTPENRRKEAIKGLHYALLKMAAQFHAANEQVANKWRGANLPDSTPTPGKPPGGKEPVTKP